ncbi:MAG: tetratricopeptide repeat protein [Verrucomicrobia bacterium]|nr:tetratricopeptide repeat protein [Verrucomicrobiota bacterium]MCF7709346.1 tetratricopeptide repeat protein [Verrucomicrobiota bacterium]
MKKARMRNPRRRSKKDTKPQAVYWLPWLLLVILTLAGMIFFNMYTPGEQGNRRGESQDEPRQAPAAPESAGEQSLSGLEQIPSPGTGQTASTTSTTGGGDPNEMLRRSNLMLNQGKPAEALKILKTASKLAPEDEDIQYNLGIAYARLDKIDEAINAYKKALEIMPNYAEVYNNLGNMLMRRGDLEQAVTNFAEAVRLIPDYALAHNNLGIAYARLEDHSNAVIHLKRAMELNPDYVSAHFNLASVYAGMDRDQEAISELEKTIELSPEFEPAKRMLSTLRGDTNSAVVPESTDYVGEQSNAAPADAISGTQ